MLDNFSRWTTRYPRWMLVIVTVAVLLPFLAKPFNIDDPLFVAAARQIQSHPLNPYDFNINWYGDTQPMWSVTENPPVASYFMALAAQIVGWNEIGLHLAFLLPVIAVVLGTHRLATRLCRRPVLAALATLLAPGMLVSATTVMCDVMMLAFWIWAMVFWLEAENDWRKLALAAVLMALAGLTKYYGICLVPLLAVFRLWQRRTIERGLAFLLIPPAALWGFQVWTHALYGYGLFSEAMHYASSEGAAHGIWRVTAAIAALSFVGGCAATIMFCMPLLSRGRLWIWVSVVAVAAVMAAIVFASPMMGTCYAWMSGPRRMGVQLQTVFWAVGGMWVLALVVQDFWRNRDATSGLLLLWVIGTFVFTAFFNWTVNARSILPMIPALGILLARRLDVDDAIAGKASFCIAAASVLALATVHADFRMAIAVRQTVQQVMARHESASTVWFEGHWGFQYYLEAAGAKALVKDHSSVQPGDWIVIPVNATSLWPLKKEPTRQVGTIAVPGPEYLTTWNGLAGGGFYASTRGPVPFAFGPVPPEKATVYEVEPPAAHPPE